MTSPLDHLPRSPAADDEAAWAAIRSEWSFAPGVTFLNHGAFGAPPRLVLEARARWLAEMSRDPMHFLMRRLQPLLADVRARLGQFLGTAGDNLVLVDNSTVAMNIVAASVPLSAGDEVLATDQEYGAVMRIWERACARAGARLVVQRLPSPATSRGELCDALFEGRTPRTRLLVFSHVSSPTALALPAVEICRRARELGLPTCIDGPHALATVPVDVDALDCDYYTASCHKWLLSPVGGGFLYAHPRVQSQVRPTIVSWGHSFGQPTSWRDEFNWTGTRDPTPLLTIPDGLDFLAAVGVEAFRRRTHALVDLARRRAAERWPLPPLAAPFGDWYGSLVPLPVPDGEALPLQEALWEQFQIEVPVFHWQGRRLVRVSCQMYTTADDIDRLCAALAHLVG